MKRNCDIKEKEKKKKQDEKQHESLKHVEIEV